MFWISLLPQVLLHSPHKSPQTATVSWCYHTVGRAFSARYIRRLIMYWLLCYRGDKQHHLEAHTAWILFINKLSGTPSISDPSNHSRKPPIFSRFALSTACHMRLAAASYGYFLSSKCTPLSAPHTPRDSRLETGLLSIAYQELLERYQS